VHTHKDLSTAEYILNIDFNKRKCSLIEGWRFTHTSFGSSSQTFCLLVYLRQISEAVFSAFSCFRVTIRPGRPVPKDQENAHLVCLSQADGPGTSRPRRPAGSPAEGPPGTTTPAARPRSRSGGGSERRPAGRAPASLGRSRAT